MKPMCWLLIGAAPPLLMASYWFLIDDRSGLLDWIALAAAIAVGLVGIRSTPLRRAAQAALALVYVPLMGSALFAGVIALECSTGNCL